MTKRGRGKPYMIPALFFNNETYVKIDDPTIKHAIYYSDTVLAEDLRVSIMTLRKWKTEGLIPHKELRGGVPEYKLYDVVQALLEAGYPQENPEIIQRY